MEQTSYIQAFVIGLALVLFGGEMVKTQVPPLEPEEAYLGLAENSLFHESLKFSRGIVPPMPLRSRSHSLERHGPLSVLGPTRSAGSHSPSAARPAPQPAAKTKDLE